MIRRKCLRQAETGNRSRGMCIVTGGIIYGIIPRSLPARLLTASASCRYNRHLRLLRVFAPA